MYVSGFNGYGELGLGHRSPCGRFTAVDVHALPPLKPKDGQAGATATCPDAVGITTVAAGPSKTYCLLNNGLVLESGGAGTDSNNVFAPVARLSHKLEPMVGIAATALELIAVGPNTVYVLPSSVGVAVASVRSFSVPQPQTDGCFTAVAAGSVFAVVLCRGGTLYSFGINSYGQLGLGLDDLAAVKDDALHRIWLPDLGPGERPTAIACGGCHAVALTNQGNVYVWGNNEHGQLGLGDDAASRPDHAVLRPRRVQLPDPIAVVACGDYHTLLLSAAAHGATEQSGSPRRHAALYAAGRNHCGQLTPWVGSPPPLTLAHRPPQVDAQPPRATAPSSTDDDVRTFAPVALPPGVGPVVAVAAGGGHGCSHTLLADAAGRVWGFGSNAKGQLGAKASPYSADVMVFDGLASVRLESSSEPSPHPFNPDTRAIAVAAGWRTSFVYRPLPPLASLSRVSSVRTHPPSLSMDHQLPPDVLDHVAQFLPVGDALRLMRVSRILNATVRYCWPLWRGVAAARCPFSTGVALRAQQQHLAEHGQDAEIDWVALLASSSSRRYGQITPFPCGTASRADGVFAKLVTALQSATASVSATMSKLVRSIKGGRGGDGRRVLFTGLDAAGKTTILYRLKLGEVVTTIPTIGFNVETIAYHGTEFACWDVGGPDKIRPLWRHYYASTCAHLFVVDANDKERIHEAARECGTARCGGLSHVPLLVVANKQDLPGALSVEQVAAAFKKASPCPLIGTWCVQGVCAVSGEGLLDCLEWLAWAVQHPEPYEATTPSTATARE